MYTSFHIENYRCFKSLDIPTFKRINLIAGKNSVGKTAILEAMFLHCGNRNVTLPLAVNRWRGYENFRVDLFDRHGQQIWDSIFRDFDPANAITLTGVDNKTGRRVVRLRNTTETEGLSLDDQLDLALTNESDAEGFSTDTSPRQFLELSQTVNGEIHRHYLIMGADKLMPIPPAPEPPFPATFSSDKNRNSNENAQRFQALKERGERRVLEEALRVIEPNLNRIEVGAPYGSIALEAILQNNERPIPLGYMGDGIARLTSIILSFSYARGGVVLIDEIENGMHYSILPQIWNMIDRASNIFETQAIITTHSFEAIAAAHKHFSSVDYDFMFHRLESKDTDIKLRTFEQDMLESAIENQFEVR